MTNEEEIHSMRRVIDASYELWLELIKADKPLDPGLTLAFAELEKALIQAGRIP